MNTPKNPIEYDNPVDFESKFLENIGLFVNRVTQTPNLFIIDDPFPAPDTQSIGLKIVLTRPLLGWTHTNKYDENGYGVIDTPYIFTVEFIAFHGSPNITLAMLKDALHNFDELKYQTLKKNNISFLSATDVGEINTIYDSIQTIKKARMLADFGVRLVRKDLEPTPFIEAVGFSAKQYDTDKNSSPIEFSGLVGTPLELPDAPNEEL